MTTRETGATRRAAEVLHGIQDIFPRDKKEPFYTSYTKPVNSSDLSASEAQALGKGVKESMREQTTVPNEELDLREGMGKIYGTVQDYVNRINKENDPESIPQPTPEVNSSLLTKRESLFSHEAYSKCLSECGPR